MYTLANRKYRGSIYALMISRELKATYYFLMGFPMKLSGALYRNLKAPRSGQVKVQLGPGQENYLPNWINVDANVLTAKCDVWADLRNKLPFRDGSVDAFYSHHVIEHLPDKRLPFHFEEMYRCLKPGGVFRVGGPNGDAAIQKFTEGDKEWFSDFPDQRESIGGKLANFIFVRNEHFTILTESYLDEIARGAGFPEVRTCRPVTETHHPEHIDPAVLDTEYESTPEVPHTLIVEGQKPT